MDRANGPGMFCESGTTDLCGGPFTVPDKVEVFPKVAPFLGSKVSTGGVPRMRPLLLRTVATLPGKSIARARIMTPARDRNEVMHRPDHWQIIGQGIKEAGQIQPSGHPMEVHYLRHLSDCLYGSLPDPPRAGDKPAGRCPAIPPTRGQGSHIAPEKSAILKGWNHIGIQRLARAEINPALNARPAQCQMQTLSRDSRTAG